MPIPYLTEYPSLIDENNGRAGFLRGHSKGDGGAQSPATGMSEWEYYGPVLPEVAKHLQKKGVVVDIYQRDGRYEWGAMRDIVNHRSATIAPYDLVTMGHLNAFNTRARGTEVLYWHDSPNGKIAAECMLEYVQPLFGGPNRGIKALHPNERAWKMLYTIRDVALIVEAGFIDNSEDEKALIQYRDLFDEAIVNGTIAYLEYKGIEMED